MPGLPIPEVPEWLSGISTEIARDRPFPLLEILRDSLYYPASEFHGAPIQYFARYILSFVYVDYGYYQQKFERELINVGFKGYRCVVLRTVNEEELAPQGWVPIRYRPEDGNPEKHRDWIKPFFCSWAVLQRCAGYTADHGPERFSLLFICADGVAAFNTLYVQNWVAPKAIAIIQPGTGFGMNWTEFEDSEKVLGRSVLGNPGGRPELLLNGGAGGRCGLGGFNAQPWWPGYKDPVTVNDDGSNFLGDTGISVWAKT